MKQTRIASWVCFVAALFCGTLGGYYAARGQWGWAAVLWVVGLFDLAVFIYNRHAMREIAEMNQRAWYAERLRRRMGDGSR